MVYLLARDAWLCVLLDSRGGSAAVQSFVSDAWESFIDTQPQSLLQQAFSLRTALAAAPPAAPVSQSPLPDVVPASVTSAAARLSAREAGQRLREGPQSASAVVAPQTAEALWTAKRIVAQVRRALAAQARQVVPRATGARRGAENERSRDPEEEEEEEEEQEEDGGLFCHDMAVLVPIRLCEKIRGLTLRQVIDLCSQAGNANCRSSTRLPPISLIMNPLVSPSGNTFRKEKNERIDKIRRMVFTQHYNDMARTGGGGQLKHSTQSIQKQEKEQQSNKESFSAFLRDASIGFDMLVMALSGGIVGYYIAHVRGLTANMCIVYGVIGLVLMLFVDAVLFILRVGRLDEQTRKDKQRRWRLWNPKKTKSKLVPVVGNSDTDEVAKRAKKED